MRFCIRPRGRYKDAEKNFVGARRIYAEAHSAGDFDVGRVCYGLGLTYYRMGRFEEGIGLLEEALPSEQSLEHLLRPPARRARLLR